MQETISASSGSERLTGLIKLLLVDPNNPDRRRELMELLTSWDKSQGSITHAQRTLIEENIGIKNLALILSPDVFENDGKPILHEHEVLRIAGLTDQIREWFVSTRENPANFLSLLSFPSDATGCSSLLLEIERAVNLIDNLNITMAQIDEEVVDLGLVVAGIFELTPSYATLRTNWDRTKELRAKTLETAAKELQHWNRAVSAQATIFAIAKAASAADFDSALPIPGYRKIARALLEDIGPSRVAYSDEHRVLLKPQIDALLKTLEEKEFTSWRDSLETNFPSIAELKDLIIRLSSTRVEDLSDIEAELKNLTDLIEKVERDTNISGLSAKQQDYLQRTYLNIAKDLQKKLEGARPTAGGTVEPPKTSEGILGGIETAIGAMLRKGYYDFVVYTNNPLMNEVNRIKTDFRRIREKPHNKVEVDRLWNEFLRVQFVVYKATIVHIVEKFEFNDDSSSKVDEKKQGLFDPLLEELGALCGEVPTDKRDIYQTEYLRFKHQIDAQVGFYLAAKSIKNQVLGITDSPSDPDVALELPRSNPVFFNGLTNKNIGSLLSGGVGFCNEADLSYEGEMPFNRVIERRMVRFYNPETLRDENRVMEVTAWGQALRNLDLFFEGRVPKSVNESRRKDIQLRRRFIFQQESSSIHEIVCTYEEARLNKLYEKDLASYDSRRPPVGIRPNRKDEKYQIKITKEDSLRAWNMSVIFINPLRLAPSSFNKGAPGYYALSPDYAMGEIAGSESGTTSAVSALAYFGIVGPCFPHLATADNPYGLIFTFDQYENNQNVDGGVEEKIARTVHPKRIREKMRAALNSNGLGEYEYLTELPLLPIWPNGFSTYTNSLGAELEKYRYNIFTTPLSNIPMRDSSGRVVRCPDKDTRIPNDNNPIMTFDDFVDINSIDEDNPNGDRLYEMMPFANTQHLEEEVKSWMAQVKNAINFFQNILWLKEEQFANMSDLSALVAGNKDIKYAAGLLEPYALEKRYAGVSEEKLKMRIVLTVLLIQGILKLANNKKMDDVKAYIKRQTVGDREGREAVVVCLEAGFSTAAMARTFITQLAEQIINAMKLK